MGGELDADGSGSGRGGSERFAFDFFMFITIKPQGTQTPFVSVIHYLIQGTVFRYFLKPRKFGIAK